MNMLMKVGNQKPLIFCVASDRKHPTILTLLRTGSNVKLHLFIIR